MDAQSRAEPRAVDMFAIVLSGFGILAAILGLLLPRARWVPCGIVLASLGFILNAKLRRIIANGGSEDAHHGKPIASPPTHLDV